MTSERGKVRLMQDSEVRHWVGVISEEHAMRGIAGGFTQVCHGKQAPLARMREGDWFYVYSPKTKMSGGEPLRAFTGFGRVAGPVHSFDTGGGFVPFRRAIDWCTEAKPVSLDALRAALQFLSDSGWGTKARRGHFEIAPTDGHALRTAMLSLAPPQPSRTFAA
jgi:EVE domain